MLLAPGTKGERKTLEKCVPGNPDPAECTIAPLVLESLWRYCSSIAPVRTTQLNGPHCGYLANILPRNSDGPFSLSTSLQRLMAPRPLLPWAEPPSLTPQHPQGQSVCSLSLGPLCPNMRALLPAVPSSNPACPLSSFHPHFLTRALPTHTDEHALALCVTVPQLVCLTGQ